MLRAFSPASHCIMLAQSRATTTHLFRFSRLQTFFFSQTHLTKAIGPCHVQRNNRASISSTAFNLTSNLTSHSSTPASSPHSEAEAEEPEGGYRGLLAYPFGLPGVENTIDSYRASSSASTAASLLDSLSKSLATERHAIELDSALQQKGVFQGEANRRANAGKGQPSSSGFEELASRVDLLHADITSLETEGILVEKYQKTFVLYRPDSESSATSSPLPSADGLRFVCSWFTQQHPARRELATYSFHASIRCQPFNVAHDDSGELREVGSAMRLFDVSECDSTRNDVQLFQAIYHSYAGKGVTEKEFAWFISFLASHPSDRAFDVVSDCLMKEK